MGRAPQAAARASGDGAGWTARRRPARLARLSWMGTAPTTAIVSQASANASPAIWARTARSGMAALRRAAQVTANASLVLGGGMRSRARLQEAASVSRAGLGPIARRGAVRMVARGTADVSRASACATRGGEGRVATRSSAQANLRARAMDIARAASASASTVIWATIAPTTQAVRTTASLSYHAACASEPQGDASALKASRALTVECTSALATARGMAHATARRAHVSASAATRTGATAAQSMPTAGLHAKPDTARASRECASASWASSAPRARRCCAAPTSSV